jgi:hypothetical protein
MALTAEDIQVGKTYRAKRYQTGLFGYGNNDRYVLWRGMRNMKVRGEGYRNVEAVQYDSDIVRFNGHYPFATVEAFVRWASHEVKEDEG